MSIGRMWKWAFAATLILSLAARAQDAEDKTRDAANEMSQEFADCAAFYTLGSKCSENTVPGSGEGGKASAEWAIKDMYLEGKIARMTNDALLARLKLTMKAERDWMKDDCVNVAVILERFGETCKPLLESPNTRYMELMIGGTPWAPIP